MTWPEMYLVLVNVGCIGANALVLFLTQRRSPTPLTGALFWFFLLLFCYIGFFAYLALLGLWGQADTANTLRMYAWVTRIAIAIVSVNLFTCLVNLRLGSRGVWRNH